MKSLIALVTASFLLISATASANASFFDLTVKENVKTEKVATRAEALKAGEDKLAALKTLSPRQLSNEFGRIHPDVIERTVKLANDGFVTVEKRVDANGKASYVGVVNLDVSFDTHDRDN